MRERDSPATPLMTWDGDTKTFDDDDDSFQDRQCWFQRMLMMAWEKTIS